MKYNEIFRLKEMLEQAEIPFAFLEIFNGFQICYPKNDESEPNQGRICSVIEHDFSYGREEDTLEIMGLLTAEEKDFNGDDVLGYLSAENVFNRIKTHYTKENYKSL